jgi:wobble nucleotide-excising tRNase
MIRKLVCIKNVGRFRSYNAVGDVEFRRLTIVFGENGRGKTTLASILRSLQSGNSAYVAERQTLNVTDPPEVSVLLQSGPVTFRNGAWSTACPGIEVFDERFVHENVYAGDRVEHEHKKNLYRVIVGEEGVRLAGDVNRLDAEIRDANKELASRKAALDPWFPAGMALDEFLALAHEDGIEGKVEALEADLAALKRSGEILGKGLLRPLALPDVPTGIVALLARTLDGVSSAAEERVRAHIRSCMDSRGEAWVAQGLGYSRGTDCPFCGQALGPEGIIHAYQSFFSEGYGTLKRDVAALQTAVESGLDGQVTLRLQRDLGDNRSLADFWRQFVAFELPPVTFEEIHSCVEELRASAQELVARKLSAPLELVAPTPRFADAQAAQTRLLQRAEEYNRAVAVANEAIARKKAGTSAGNAERTHQELARARAVQVRYSVAAVRACQNYVASCQVKKALESAKRTAKTQLDDYSAGVFATYQGELNELLGKFNAGFRVDRTKGGYVGGTPNSSYVIVINDTAVELGDAKADGARPCFSNTLSAGDRSALALAFFMARLHHDPRLGEKVVVFDDPITSQDLFRATCTRHLLWRLVTRARQVVVLSHNPHFLKYLWDGAVRREVKTLQITRQADQSAILEWDIERETRGEYYRNYDILSDYVTTGAGELRAVARCIRLVLEEYLRLKAPRAFHRTEWLGDFIGKIRGAASTDVLYGARSILPELEEINEYAKRYHHPENPGAATEPIADAELQGYAKRTLDLVGRF